MSDCILTIILLLCLAHTTMKAVSWLLDVLTVKFFVNDHKLENVISRLISLTSLRWGGIEDDKDYTVTTKGYIVIVKKNKNKDK